MFFRKFQQSGRSGHFFIAFAVFVLLLSLVPGALALSGPVIKLSIVDEDPYPAQAGDRLRILVQIENTGLKTDNVTVNVVSDYPFSVSAAESTREIGTMISGRKVYEEFYITVADDVLPGVRDLTIRYKTEDNSHWVEKKFPVAVGTQSFDSMGTVVVENVSSSPESFMPGDSGIINVTLKNTAASSTVVMKNATYDTNAHIQGIELMSQSDIVVTTDARRDIGIIAAGDSLTVPFQVTVPEGTPDGQYLLTLAVRGNSYEYNIQRDIVVNVDSKAIGVIQSSAPSAGTLELDVINYHSGSLKSVSVEPIMDGVTFFPPVYFIGEMSADDLYTIKFNLSDGSGNFNLPSASSRNPGPGGRPGVAVAETTDENASADGLTLKISYINGYTSHEDTLSGDNIIVSVPFSREAGSGGGLSTLILAVVFVLIVLAAAHLYLKKKKGVGLKTYAQDYMARRKEKKGKGTA